jgi:two-component SAPR family response regulator
LASVRPRAQVRLHDFGAPALEVDGHQVAPRISKAYELVAVLSTKPHGTIDRLDALSTLFAEHPTRTAATYLRQTCHHLRQILPDPGALHVEDGRIRFAPDVLVRADSIQFESSLTEASYLGGPERVDAIAEILALIQRGPYLARIETPWVVQRRQRLADQAAALRFDAAELCFSLGRLNDADRYCQAALTDDRYQESAWRLRMRISNALGDERGVLHAYRQCAEALTELGTEPAASTRDLLARLRR